VELVGRVHVVGKSEDGIFEREQCSGVDVELDVQINWAAATVLGMQVNLPGLT
jgi:hypothetical protein